MKSDEDRLPQIKDMENLTAISVLDDGETWGGTGKVRFLSTDEMCIVSEGNLSDIESDKSAVVSISVDELLRSYFELLQMRSVQG